MPGCQADSDTSDKDVEFDGDCTTTTLLSDQDDQHNTSTLPLQVPPVSDVTLHAVPTQTVLTPHGSSHKVFNVTNYGNVDEAPVEKSKSMHNAMWTLGYDTSDDTTCYTEEEQEQEEEEDDAEEGEEEDKENNNVKHGPMLLRYVDTRRPPSPPPRDRANSMREHYRRAMAKQGILAPLAERGRLYAERKVHRFIAKTGELNMTFKNVGGHWRYLADIFTTLMDMRWRYDILLFVVAFVFSWLAFAVMWYVIIWWHEDVDHVDDDAWTPCVDGVDDFTSALLFSIETQHTIGYGTRAVTRKCPAAIFLVMFQSVTGVFIQCLVTGIIFAKLSRGKNRAQTILFSKTAVLCTRHGYPCLMFRVGDMRRSQIIDATIHVLLLKRKLTDYGEVLPTFQHYLKVYTESDDSFFFLPWPTKVIHRITANSPLWTVTAESLLLQEMEIVVILEGVVEGTGMSTQVRTSYLPCEIMWGHRLAPLMTYHSENGQHTIDYRQFHSTIPIDMPECSPKEMVQRLKKAKQSEKQNNAKQVRKKKSRAT